MSSSGTLQDVIRRAGVSSATVSRVINGRPGIADETRRRVQQAIEDVGYEPNPQVARFFKTLHGGNHTVALAFAHRMDRLAPGGEPFYSRLSMAVQGELSRHDHHTLLVNTSTDRTADGNLNCVAEGLCKGIIAEVHDAQVIQQFSAHVPVVLINVDMVLPHVDVVIPHVERAATRQIQHLVELGHRRIACFRPRASAMSLDLHWQDARFWRGYEDACQHLGLAIPDPYLVPISIENQSDAPAVAAFLDRVMAFDADAPTAILTYDQYAGELIRQLQARGKQVPRDVSIFGYDDFMFGKPCPMHLSTYRQDFQTMASHAVNLLLTRLAHPQRSAAMIQVDGELVHRDSVAPAPQHAGDSRS
ncbi:MAG: LacI family DNA-binding transcriptional regulator [Phycisphaeraceae bacterium]|nr:LacI family DNA-binding transcriptional regulator [Phycisphaeraceae bacterium]